MGKISLLRLKKSNTHNGQEQSGVNQQELAFLAGVSGPEPAGAVEQKAGGGKGKVAPLSPARKKKKL